VFRTWAWRLKDSMANGVSTKHSTDWKMGAIF